MSATYTNATDRHRNLAIPRLARRKHAISRFALACVLLTPFLAQASSVTVNLGLSAQDLTETGIGQNSSGIGQWFITLGTCTPAGGNTTCILSGNFTSSAAGLASGTYSLATTYVGTGSTPIQAVQQTAGSDFFVFSSIPGSATITLTLVSSSGSLIVPLVANSQFLSGASLFFSPGGIQTCSGTHVSTCTPGNVSLTPGAGSRHHGPGDRHGDV
jgi:hypothetical protein